MICLGHLGYHFGLSGSGLIAKVFGHHPRHVPLVASHIRLHLAAVSGLTETPPTPPLREPQPMCKYLFAKLDGRGWHGALVGVIVTLFVHDLLYKMYTLTGGDGGLVVLPFARNVCRTAAKYFNNHAVH